MLIDMIQITCHTNDPYKIGQNKFVQYSNGKVLPLLNLNLEGVRQ